MLIPCVDASVGTNADQHLQERQQMWTKVEKCAKILTKWGNILGNVEMWDVGPASVATNVDVVWTSKCWINTFHISVHT
jgi:hypothetical protein